MINKEPILKVVEAHKGELVLDLFEVVRLEGFHEDKKDRYYVFRSLDRGRYYSSCAGYFVPLKGIINEKHYTNLVKAFDLKLPRWTREELYQLFIEFAKDEKLK